MYAFAFDFLFVCKVCAYATLRIYVCTFRVYLFMHYALCMYVMLHNNDMPLMFVMCVRMYAYMYVWTGWAYVCMSDCMMMHVCMCEDDACTLEDVCIYVCTMVLSVGVVM